MASSHPDRRPQSVSAAVRRFSKTPKGLLTIILVVWAALAAPHEGWRVVLASIGAAVGVAMLVDLPILRWREGTWVFPSGAALTGLIVAMVLSPHEPWYVSAVTAAVAILSKYIVRTTSANVFNPAAVAIVATFYVFDSGQSWWGALPELGGPGLVLLIGAGVFIADRVNKMPLVLAFLGTYYSLFTAMAFFGEPRFVAEIYRAPDLQAVLFFALIILTDPPTSPVKYPGQIVCGVLVAVVSFVVFEWLGVVYYLLAGVLVGNVWEAVQRVRARRLRHHGSKVPASAPVIMGDAPAT